MKRIDTLSPNLIQLRQRLEDWRQQQPGRQHIPEPLWGEALALARAEGVSRVSRVLRLHYQRLKDRLNGISASTPRVSAPAFVELPLPCPLPEGRECRVELIPRTGARMTIHLSAASSGNLLPLAQAFWSQRR